MKILLLTSVCSLLACTGNKTEEEVTEITSDQDGDGFSIADGDCDDANDTINPDAEDAWYDGADTNCDGADDYDADGDGYVSDEYAEVSSLPAGDCWDDGSDISVDFVAINGFDQPTADMVHPAAEEVYYDGVNQDCSDDQYEFDQDRDEDFTDSYPNRDGDIGGDCVDNAEDAEEQDIGDFLPAEVGSYVAESYYDGIDQNCDGLSDFDADGDGNDSDQHGGDDCDDTDSSVHPGAVEVFNDGIDQDCDNEEYCPQDLDGDGFGGSNSAYSSDLSCQGVGVADNIDDCNDAEATIYPGAAEDADETDHNCDGMEAGGHLACSGDTVLNDSNEEVYFLYCGEFVGQAEAQLTCQNYGYNLATVNDETENNEISSYFAWFFKAWLGLTDQALETVFVWPDGSSPSYTNWDDEMAPALSTAENCVAVDGYGVWYNEDCALERYYVCESR